MIKATFIKPPTLPMHIRVAIDLLNQPIPSYKTYLNEGKISTISVDKAVSKILNVNSGNAYIAVPN